MALTDIDLGSLGRFDAAPASFVCTQFDLPQPWDYVYANGRVLLRVRHDGAGYLQVDPPAGVPLLAGPPLLLRENGHVCPSWFTWIISHDGPRPQAFGNFLLPAMPLEAATPPHDEYTCRFEPQQACYSLRRLDWLVQTELLVPPDTPSAVMTVTVTNVARRTRRCTLMPVLRPHLAPLSQSPWDVAAWYQTAAFCGVGGQRAFWFQTRHHGGDPAKRLHAAMVTDFQAERFEVAYDGFVGGGQWHAPRSVQEGRLARICPRRLPAYGRATREIAAIGQPPVAALERTLVLQAGQSHSFSMVVTRLPDRADGKLPSVAALAEPASYLRASQRAEGVARLTAQHSQWMSARRLQTPDECLNRYVNEFLPLQAHWVSMLDRGWPTPFRGTRDAAQDATSIIPLAPRLARERLIEVFSHQRDDGWFPRAYFLDRREALPAAHADAGVWAWELLWEYLCHTGDFDVLDVTTPWLGAARPVSVLQHAIQLLEYYLAPENLGEHGLCKIRGGDWNDSINLAGVAGRGESVMISCQLVLALEQAAVLMIHLAGGRKGGYVAAARRFEQACGAMRQSLRTHALNDHGYFNGVWTDAGQWVFSPRDPDRRRRVSGPANAFAIIAGVPHQADRPRVLQALASLKGPHGWRLFYPPIGERPIAHLGRIGQGDLAPGLGENGTPYNHGSHGFLGRAAWTAGQGTLCYDVLRHMLPYDQGLHPVTLCRTAPYGVVNHWKEAPGLQGQGGDVFLSGSIATALRNAYEGLVGFRPALDHVVIDPCIPAAWRHCQAEVAFRGSRLSIEIANPEGIECGVAELRLDGQLVTQRRHEPRLGREVVPIPHSRLRCRRHRLQVRLG